MERSALECLHCHRSQVVAVPDNREGVIDLIRRVQGCCKNPKIIKVAYHVS